MREIVSRDERNMEGGDHRITFAVKGGQNKTRFKYHISIIGLRKEK